MRASRSFEAIGDTPLIELPAMRPAGGARVLLKWEAGNPTGSMKDRMALAMIESAERKGKLNPGDRVVEATGGSTGSSLAFVCAAKGYPLSIVTADAFAQEKTSTMRALGADVEVLETPEGRVHPGLMDRMRERVQAIQKETGAYWTNQFENADQFAGYAPMGAEILRDCPEITDFVMIVGTAGCAMGTARAMRARKEDVRVHVVEPEEAAYLSHCMTGVHCVEGTAMNFRPPLLDDALHDGVICIPEKEGRDMACRMAREEGLLAGTSTGMNLAAALRVARDLPEDACVVTVGCDTGLKYLAGSLYRMHDD